MPALEALMSFTAFKGLKLWAEFFGEIMRSRLPLEEQLSRMGGTITDLQSERPSYICIKRARWRLLGEGASICVETPNYLFKGDIDPLISFLRLALEVVV
jgi:hypothetical protein